jgi:hypothetical protein
MRVTFHGTIAAILLLLPLAAISVVLGYVTGNDYLKLSEPEQTTWLVGTMDGVMAEDFSVTKPSNGPWLGRCVGSLPINQVKAMFDQELKSKPESWHAPAAFIFRQRMERFCRGRL